MNQPALSSDQPIRLVLVELLPRLTEIVERLVAGSGIEVVKELDDRSELPEFLAQKRVDVVLVPTERSGFAREYHDLMKTDFDVKVLAIAMTPSSADLCELCSWGRNITEQGLVEAIRGVVGRERPGVGHGKG